MPYIVLSGKLVTSLTIWVTVLSRKPLLLTPDNLMKWKHFDTLGILEEMAGTRLKIISEAGQF